MKFLEQLKFMALGALVILAIAYGSYQFDIETRAFAMLVIMFICSEIQYKQK